MSIKYVVGLLFDKDQSNLLLIEKKKPEWQDGLLNGIGGKVERGESPLEAMQREFKEEAGVYIEEWDNFATINGHNSIIYFFYSVFDATLSLKTFVNKEGKGENLYVFPFWEYGCLCPLPDNIVPNLEFLVPMALNKIHRRTNVKLFEIYTVGETPEEIKKN